MSESFIVILTGTAPTATRAALVGLHESQRRSEQSSGHLKFDDGAMIPIGRLNGQVGAVGIYMITLLYGSREHPNAKNPSNQKIVEYEQRALLSANLVLHVFDPENTEASIEHLDELLGLLDQRESPQHVVALTARDLSAELSLRRAISRHQQAVRLEVHSHDGAIAELLLDYMSGAESDGAMNDEAADTGEKLAGKSERSSRRTMLKWGTAAAVVLGLGLAGAGSSLYREYWRGGVLLAGEKTKITIPTFLALNEQLREFKPGSPQTVMFNGGAAYLSQDADVILQRYDHYGAIFDVRSGRVDMSIDNSDLAMGQGGLGEWGLEFADGYSAIVLGTEYSLEKRESGVYEIVVSEGAVLVSGPDCTGFMVRSGQMWELRNTHKRPCGLIRVEAGGEFRPVKPIEVDVIATPADDNGSPSPNQDEGGGKPGFEAALREHLNRLTEEIGDVDGLLGSLSRKKEKVDALHALVERGSDSKLCRLSKRCRMELQKAYVDLEMMVRDNGPTREQLYRMYKKTFPFGEALAPPSE